MNYILDQFDKNRLSDGNNLFKSISLKDAICFVHTAWNNVTKTIIINCLKHTKIINEKDSGDIKSIIEEDTNYNIIELDDLLKDLDDKSDFPAKEYLHIEGESDLYPNMDDKSILNSVQNNVEDDEDLNGTV